MLAVKTHEPFSGKPSLPRVTKFLYEEIGESPLTSRASTGLPPSGHSFPAVIKLASLEMTE